MQDFLWISHLSVYKYITHRNKKLCDLGCKMTPSAVIAIVGKLWWDSYRQNGELESSEKW
jgi:hypothetical protein